MSTTTQDLKASDMLAEVMKIRTRMRADGASPQAIDEFTAKALRSSLEKVFPPVREWKYLCERCSDTGWAHAFCTPRYRCGRPMALPKQREDDYTGKGECGEGHEYVYPCHCTKGASRLANLERRPSTEDFTSATKMPKQPTRFGR